MAYFLRRIRSSGATPEGLCESHVSRIYKTLARKAGLQESIVQRISGFSMCVGEAHDLLTVGASLPQIMVKGGWLKTDTVMRYVERVRQPIQERLLSSAICLYLKSN